MPIYNWVANSTIEEGNPDAYPTDGPIRVKFKKTVDRSSLINANFTLTKVSDSSNVPFVTIDTDRDYEALSKVLTLYLQNPLEASTTYEFHVHDLIDVAGNTQDSGDDYIVQFTSSSVSAPDPQEPTDPEPINIIDITTELLGDSSLGSDLRIEEVLPQAGAIVFTSATPTTAEGRGVIKVYFSEDINEASLAGQVNVLKRPLSIAPKMYEPLDIQTSVSGNVLDILLPSTDATPVYDTLGAVYFEDNTEYKIVLSTNIASTDGSTLPAGFSWSIFGETTLAIDPMLLSDVVEDVPAEDLVKAIWIKTSELVKLDVDLESTAAINYVLWATLCYLQEVIGFPIDSASIKLGDLSIDRFTRLGDPRDAPNPCAKAIMWWLEIGRSTTGIKKFNPRIQPSEIPSRRTIDGVYGVSGNVREQLSREGRWRPL